MLVDPHVELRALTLTGLAEGSLQCLRNLPLFWLLSFPKLLLLFVDFTVNMLLDGIVVLGHALVACCTSQLLTEQIHSLFRPVSETLLGCLFAAPFPFRLVSCARRADGG